MVCVKMCLYLFAAFPIIVKPQQKYKTINRSGERYEFIYNAATRASCCCSCRRLPRQKEKYSRLLPRIHACVRVYVHTYVIIIISECVRRRARFRERESEREREMRYLKMVLQGRHPLV